MATSERVPAVGSATQIELNGINVISEDERKGTPRDLFWPWFAANVSILAVAYGSFLLFSFPLSFTQAVVAGVVGIVFSFLLCGFVSIAGKRASAPTLVVSRAVLGVDGQQAAHCGLVGAHGGLGDRADGARHPGDRDRVRRARMGRRRRDQGGRAGHRRGAHRGCRCHRLRPHHAHADGHHGGHGRAHGRLRDPGLEGGRLGRRLGACRLGRHQQFIGALIFMATGFGLGWVNVAADYSRYLPRSASSRGVIGWTTFGASLAPVPLLVFGLLLAGSSEDLKNAIAADPIGALTPILPTWFLIPFVVVAVLGLVGGAVLDIYSSGLALLTLGLRIPRWSAALVDGCVMIAGTDLRRLLLRQQLPHDLPGLPHHPRRADRGVVRDVPGRPAGTASRLRRGGPLRPARSIRVGQRRTGAHPVRRDRDRMGPGDEHVSPTG